MTTYTIKKFQGSIAIEISGHSGYADKGYDIVCAAISTACITIENFLDRADFKATEVLDCISEDGYFRLQVKTGNKIVMAAFGTLVGVLEALNDEYPNFIKNKN